MDANIYSQMKVSKPYKSYIKTILGKVYVKSLNFIWRPKEKIRFVYYRRVVFTRRYVFTQSQS